MAFILVALVALIPFTLIVIKEARFLHRVRGYTELCKGTVTVLTEKLFFGTTSHRSTFYPTVRYEYEGVVYEAAAEHSYHYDDHPTGSEVWIYIDPAKPSRMILAAEKKTAATGIVTTILLTAVVFIYAAVLAAKHGL